MIDRMKIHKIVEYIKQHSFNFEPDEVRENVRDILNDYGVSDETTREEEEVLVEELMPFAERYQEREICRLVFHNEIEYFGLC